MVILTNFFIGQYNQVLLVKTAIKNWFAQVLQTTNFFGHFNQSVFTVYSMNELNLFVSRHMIV